MKGLGTKKQRLEVLLEDMDGKIDLILEHTSSLRELPPKVEKIAEDLEDVKITVDAIKVGQTQLREDVNVLQRDVKDIKKDLGKKADKEEVDKLKQQFGKFA